MYKKPSILFVSWTARTSRPYFDVSVRYRCFHPAAALQSRGYKVQVISQETLQKDTSIADNYDRMLFHRPYLTPEIVAFMDRAARQKTAIADFDDLIFDVAAAEWTSMVRSRGANPTGIRNYLSRNAGATKLFKLISVSTSPLKERGSQIFPAAKFVTIHNALIDSHIGICKMARQDMHTRRRPYRFGYFSGTATHDADFSSIAPFLCNEMKKSPKSRLLIVGPVKLPIEFNAVASQIDRRDLVSFARLPWHIAQVENVLAPLEDNPFNQCKSGLKFFESAIVGSRVIATPIPDIDRFDSCLLTKCKTSDEWASAIAESSNTTASQRKTEAERIAELCSIDRELKTFCEHAGL